MRPAIVLNRRKNDVTIDRCCLCPCIGIVSPSYYACTPPDLVERYCHQSSRSMRCRHAHGERDVRENGRPPWCQQVRPWSHLLSQIRTQAARRSGAAFGVPNCPIRVGASGVSAGWLPRTEEPPPISRRIQQGVGAVKAEMRSKQAVQPFRIISAAESAAESYLSSRPRERALAPVRNI